MASINPLFTIGKDVACILFATGYVRTIETEEDLTMMNTFARGPQLTPDAKFSPHLDGFGRRTPRDVAKAVERLTLLRNPSRMEPQQQETRS